MRHFWTIDRSEERSETYPRANFIGDTGGHSRKRRGCVNGGEKEAGVNSRLIARVAGSDTNTRGRGQATGRLGFAQSCFYGKYGRAHLAPFTDRQYSRVHHGGHFLDTALFEVLPWRIRALGVDKPRRATCDVARPVLVYTDACGEGHLGVSLFIDGRAVVAHCHVPQWMRTLGIAELELAGAIFGLTMAAEFAPGRNVLLRCDNQGARGVVARGHSRTVNGRRLAAVFWSVAAPATIHVWAEFVCSGANHADDPSMVFLLLGGKKCNAPMINVGRRLVF